MFGSFFIVYRQKENVILFTHNLFLQVKIKCSELCMKEELTKQLEDLKTELASL